jgi:Tfp pilus assembly protein PilF
MEAVRGYQELVREFPERVQFEIGLSLAFLAAGDIDQARAVATSATKKLPTSSGPEHALALIEGIAGNPDAAEAHAEEARRRDADSTP